MSPSSFWLLILQLQVNAVVYLETLIITRLMVKTSTTKGRPVTMTCHPGHVTGKLTECMLGTNIDMARHTWPGSDI